MLPFVLADQGRQGRGASRPLSEASAHAALGAHVEIRRTPSRDCPHEALMPPGKHPLVGCATGLHVVSVKLRGATMKAEPGYWAELLVEQFLFEQ